MMSSTNVGQEEEDEEEEEEEEEDSQSGGFSAITNQNSYVFLSPFPYHVWGLFLDRILKISMKFSAPILKRLGE